MHANMPRLQPGGECDPGSLTYDPCQCLEEPGCRSAAAAALLLPLLLRCKNIQTRTGLQLKAVRPDSFRSSAQSDLPVLKYYQCEYL